MITNSIINSMVLKPIPPTASFISSGIQTDGVTFNPAQIALNTLSGSKEPYFYMRTYSVYTIVDDHGWAVRNTR